MNGDEILLLHQLRHRFSVLVALEFRFSVALFARRARLLVPHESYGQTVTARGGVLSTSRTN